MIKSTLFLAFIMVELPNRFKRFEFPQLQPGRSVTLRRSTEDPSKNKEVRAAATGMIYATAGLEELIRRANKIAGHPVYSHAEVFWHNDLPPARAMLPLGKFVRNNLINAGLKPGTAEYSSQFREELRRRIGGYSDWLKGQKPLFGILVDFLMENAIYAQPQVKKNQITRLEIRFDERTSRHWAKFERILKDLEERGLGIRRSNEHSKVGAGKVPHGIVILPTTARNLLFMHEVRQRLVGLSKSRRKEE